MKDFSIPILYQDTHILAINKPAGLVVHSDGKTKEATLADWVALQFPESKNVGEPTTLQSGEIIHRPGIVHRLDRDTSGVLLIAKTSEGYNTLKEQFQNRHIKKTYNAFVYGVVKENEGTIDREITRSRKDFRLWSAQRGGRGEGREALTHYKVVGRNAELGDNGASYMEVTPRTGRTHQIRVHFKAINHPVVGDTLYAPKREPILGFTRLALHATNIIFTTYEGEIKEVEAPLPPDFEFALLKFL